MKREIIVQHSIANTSGSALEYEANCISGTRRYLIVELSIEYKAAARSNSS